MFRAILFAWPLLRMNYAGGVLEDADWHSARVVNEDLTYLAERWTPSFDTAALRRESPLLRRLLIDGQYARAWTALGLPGEPYVTASDLNEALGSVTREHLQYGIAPPAPEVGRLMAAALPKGEVEIRLTVIQEIPAGSVSLAMPDYPTFGAALIGIPPEVVTAEGGGDNAVRRHGRFGRLRFRGVPLGDFLRSASAVVGSVEIPRADVIRYVANKLGGAHFDADRSRRGDERLALLDTELLTVSPGSTSGINNVYAELLSIAQYVAESGDTARYRAAFAREAASRTEGPQP